MLLLKFGTVFATLSRIRRNDQVNDAAESVSFGPSRRRGFRGDGNRQADQFPY